MTFIPCDVYKTGRVNQTFELSALGLGKRKVVRIIAIALHFDLSFAI